MNRILLAGLTLACLLPAADWPQWRGPNRDGKSAETGLLKKWPDGGPPLAWKATGLGEGYSSMTVTGGRIYTLGQRGNTEYVLAFDAANGKKLWEVAAGGPFRERRGDGPRSMPTVEGDRMWAMAADGTLTCLTTAGKAVWSVNMSKFGGEVPHWGYSESPLIDGARLIVLPGGSGHAVVALDKMTGKLLWKSQNDPAGYSSAIAVTLNGTRQILAFTGQAAVGLRADNGELLWRYTNVANRTANVATPIFRDGKVFYSSAYGTGAALLNIGAGGAKEVYFSAEMMNHHATSLLIGDYLYGFSNAVFTAMKFATGEVAWKDRSVGKGSLILADGLLYLFSETGIAGLVEPSPAAYKEISRFTIPERSERPTWSHPAIAGGHLFLRDQDTLYCYDIRRK